MGTLDGLNVLDLSSLLAGPICATILGDHGANVIKVEHPNGDDARNWGGKKNGVSLWWKVISRNKDLISIDLHSKEGQKIVKKLVARTDILIENFRPGKMESWGLGYDELSKINPKLVMIRVTGFGQSGPYSNLPGFGTIAEAMSGFASVTGFSDKPPTLPSFGLADGIAGIAGAFAAMSAVFKRERTGVGEIIDLSLYDPLMWIVGPHIIEFDQLKKVQKRQGNGSSRTCPRNTYKTSDGKWIALSASAESIAKRVFELIGHSEIFELYPTNWERVQHGEEIDNLVQEWVSKYTQEEAIDILRNAEIAAAPIYDAEQIYNDSHFRFRESIVTIGDDDLGKVTMQGVFPKMFNNPGRIRFTGKDRVGYDTDVILGELGLRPDQISKLRSDGVVK